MIDSKCVILANVLHDSRRYFSINILSNNYHSFRVEKTRSE